MRRVLPFPVSCTKAVLCAILSAKGGRHHAQTDFFSRAGLCGFAAGRLCRKAADHTGLCADLCRQPARRVPTTQGAQYFADLVQQQTGGKVVIQVKANGEYGSEQQVWEQLAIGGVDFAVCRSRWSRTICPGSTCCCCRISTGMPTTCGACWTAASGLSFCRTLPHRDG